MGTQHALRILTTLALTLALGAALPTAPAFADGNVTTSVAGNGDLVIIGDVSGIPDALADASGWFPSRRGGGPRGSELPIRMLHAAKERLRAGGRLLLPTGSLQWSRPSRSHRRIGLCAEFGFDGSLRPFRQDDGVNPFR